MIFSRTRLMVIDNSGIAIVRCIRIVGYARKRFGAVGDTGIFSFVKKTPRGQLLKMRTHLGIISSVKKKRLYRNGIGVSFFQNSAFLVKWESKVEMGLLGGRLKGPVSFLCSKRPFVRKALLVHVRAFV